MGRLRTGGAIRPAVVVKTHYGESEMSPQRLVGLGLVAAGAVLFGLGLNATDAPLAQISEALTGSYPDRAIWQLVGGATAVCVGLVLTAGRRLR